MSTQTVFLTAGATSKTVDLALVQKAAATSPGDPITGLAFNTASLVAYQRSGPTSTPTAITLATQTVGGAWSSGGFVELSAANAPGGYRFDIPNAIIATAGEANIWFSGAANLATHMLKIIVTDMDFYDRAANFRKQITESYAANGAAPTPEQFMMAAHMERRNFGYAGTTKTVYKLDNVTVAYTLGYDNIVPTRGNQTS